VSGLELGAGTSTEAAGEGGAVVRMGSGAMFDGIAARYDLLNRLISLGMDKLWRRALVSAAAPPDGFAAGRVLDVATGTADVAIALARRYDALRVTGLDPSPGMLAVGAEKLGAHGLRERVELVEGDGQALPFDDAHFDAVTIAFGIRNVPDRALALREMARVTRPGGRVAVLELAEPRGGLTAPAARLYVHRVVPILGRLLSGRAAYEYLQASIGAFPPAAEFAALMQSACGAPVQVRRFPFGAAHLYVAAIADGKA
jgi:demethylmenaquinone methyltransferase/2-methoxy-6-polyprenyl-1,4-benzoquinol methylase